MVTLPHQHIPGLELLSPWEAERFALTVIRAARKHRGAELDEATLPDPGAIGEDGQAPGRSAEIVTAVALRMMAEEGR